jgi:hypothetical protein
LGVSLPDVIYGFTIYNPARLIASANGYRSSSFSNPLRISLYFAWLRELDKLYPFTSSSFFVIVVHLSENVGQISLLTFQNKYNAAPADELGG